MIYDGGSPITINEWENPCPILADWDGDGNKDLIVGVVILGLYPEVTRYRFYKN